MGIGIVSALVCHVCLAAVIHLPNSDIGRIHRRCAHRCAPVTIEVHRTAFFHSLYLVSASDGEIHFDNGNPKSRMRQRLCAAYHIERSIANRLGLAEYPCACNRCRGACTKKVHIVARHHIAHGRDPYLVYPVMVSLM